MIEIVNPSHPDKIADRIAGALVDLAYTKEEAPKMAAEVLIGHGKCFIICESSVKIGHHEATRIVDRICGEGEISVVLQDYDQDSRLAENQDLPSPRCGDNGIFLGVPPNTEEKELAGLVKHLYEKFSADGKYISIEGKIIACQSRAKSDDIYKEVEFYRNKFGSDLCLLKVNPLGYWTGGTNVDTGATNRKLGSDLGRAVTGGGLHGKDLSKADVSVNIYCHCLSKKLNTTVKAYCAIGDEYVRIFDTNNNLLEQTSFENITNFAFRYVADLGGFEKLAEWGLND